MPIRFAITLSICTGMWLCRPMHAQSVPVSRNKPTAAVALVNPPALNATPTALSTPPSALTPAERPPHRADVRYTAGQLAVTAENSSLNQILREISHETGIKITGGVAEERVFGTYGPSPPSEVLAALLDGTGSNLLLTPSDSASPGELILTPRHGGITPPNPNAPSFEDDASDDSAIFRGLQPGNQAPGGPGSPGLGFTGPAASVPAATASDSPATGQPAPAAGDGNDPQSPNTAKTPQQIFDQLQRLRQQHPTTPPQ